MSDSFYDDGDDFSDSAFLRELDAIEAASQQQQQSTKPVTERVETRPKTTSLDQVPRAKFKPASQRQTFSDDFDEDFDLDAEELHRLDAFIADSYAGKAQPVAGPSGTRQVTLDGRTLPPPPPAKEPQQKRLFNRTRSSGPKEPKVKIWDRTTFTETGFRSTKKKVMKDKEKEKGKEATRNEGNGEDFDDNEVEFEQFPSPHVEIGYVHSERIFIWNLSSFFHYLFILRSPAPPMRLKPDLLAAKDWIFPLNRPRRDYQFNIAKKCLFQNTLVALPTGLGKTFIAGVVMLNYYKWFPEGKIVFVAPTKPLVAQQINACHEVCGIPGRDSALLTGEVTRAKRISAIAQKRVIYMTPQTLVNDLEYGLIDPLDVILIVIDEAHKGTGDYSYCQVVRYMMAKNPHFRILALTATPGNNPEAVQRIVDALHISHIEIRNESSFDLQMYMHKKETVVHIIKMDEPVQKIQGLLCKVMNPLLDKLRKENVLFTRNAITLHPYSCIKGFETAQRQSSGKGAWIWAYLRALRSLSQAMGNLMESSASTCFRSLKEFKESLVNSDKNDDRYVHLLTNPDFIKLMEECERQQASGFAPHPKVKALVEIIMDHFNSPLTNADTPRAGEIDDAEHSPGTRVMIFVGLREVIDEVVDMLDQYKPMLRAARFVGQGIDKKGKKGLAQAEQLEMIQKFKKGEYNILVSTSVGEEGLDIGEIDRIICYDSSKSSIRMLQRVGRTGRKRTGYVDVLLSEEREEKNWDKSKENYADVQQTIISGNQLELYTDAERLLPDNVQPSCMQVTMPIEPYESVTAESPARKKVVEKKRKRNNDINRNIPLGAFTGFVQASKLRPKSSKMKKRKKAKDLRDSDLEDDTDDEEIAKGLHGLTSTPKNGKSKPSEMNKKDHQHSLLDLLNAPIPDNLDDDDVDLEIRRGSVPAKGNEHKGGESSDGSKSSVSPVRPRKRRRALVSTSSTSSGSDTVPDRTAMSSNPGPKSSGATISSSGEKGQQKDAGWLLESGSEAESLSKSSSRRTEPEMGRSNGAVTGFQSARSLGMPETISFSEEQDELPNKADASSSKAVRAGSFSLQESGKNHGTPVTPEPTYTINGPSRSKRASFPSAPLSSPTEGRREPPCRLRRLSPSLMPPPSVPSPRECKQKKAKLKMMDNPMLFDIEAVHSGDEVCEGEESDVDMVESDSDRHFLVELPDTQVSPSYNQTLAYRTSLMTQAPDDGSGPMFQSKKKRVGPFAGGRTQTPKPADWSSSPVRSSQPDEYEIGSFVVKDDDSVLYDQSSET